MASIRFLANRGRWWVRWRAVNRKTGHVFAGSRVFMEKSQAVRVYAEMEAQERLWRSGQVDTLDSATAAAAGYKDHCKRHTPRTQGHYRHVMSRFIDSLPANAQRLQQIDHRHIEEYLYRLRDHGVCNRTINAHLTVVKGFCRWFSQRYGLDNPAARVSMLREDPPESRFLTPEEYQALLTTPNLLARDRIIFLANTGLRASEFCQLIRSGKLHAGDTTVTVIGKGRRRRTVPLNAACREVLARPYIYRKTGRNPLYQQLSRIARQVGIPKMGPHALRHYCATQLLLAGVAPATVAKILGHSVRVLETMYSHILPRDVAGATDCLDTCLRPYPVVTEPPALTGES